MAIRVLMRKGLTLTFNQLVFVFNIFGLCLLLQSCLIGEENPLIADCQNGWSFNAVSRKCEKVIMAPAAPLAVSETFSILEEVQLGNAILLHLL